MVTKSSLPNLSSNITRNRSELLSFSREFINNWGLSSGCGEQSIEPTPSAGDTIDLTCKAVLPLDLISPTMPKGTQPGGDECFRYWQLIRKPEEPMNEPDHNRIKSFSKLVTKFRNKLGKVVHNEIKAFFAQTIERKRIEASFVPRDRSSLATYNDTIEEYKKHGNLRLYSLIQETIDETYGLTVERRDLASQIMFLFGFKYPICEDSHPTEGKSFGFVVQFVSQKRNDVIGHFNKIATKIHGHEPFRSTKQDDLRKKLGKKSRRPMQISAHSTIATYSNPHPIAPTIAAVPQYQPYLSNPVYQHQEDPAKPASIPTTDMPTAPVAVGVNDSMNKSDSNHSTESTSDDTSLDDNLLVVDSDDDASVHMPPSKNLGMVNMPSSKSIPEKEPRFSVAMVEVDKGDNQSSMLHNQGTSLSSSSTQTMTSSATGGNSSQPSNLPESSSTVRLAFSVPCLAEIVTGREGISTQPESVDGSSITPSPSNSESTMVTTSESTFTKESNQEKNTSTIINNHTGIVSKEGETVSRPDATVAPVQYENVTSPHRQRLRLPDCKEVVVPESPYAESKLVAVSPTIRRQSRMMALALKSSMNCSTVVSDVCTPEHQKFLGADETSGRSTPRRSSQLLEQEGDMTSKTDITLPLKERKARNRRVGRRVTEAPDIPPKGKSVTDVSNPSCSSTHKPIVTRHHTVSQPQTEKRQNKTKVKCSSKNKHSSCHLPHILEELRTEDNSAYWGEGFFLHQKTCHRCSAVYNSKKPRLDKNEKSPAMVYYCQNVTESNGALCLFTLCSDCWNHQLLNREPDGVGGGRTQNKRKRTLFRNANYVY